MPVGSGWVGAQDAFTACIHDAALTFSCSIMPMSH